MMPCFVVASVSLLQGYSKFYLDVENHLCLWRAGRGDGTAMIVALLVQGAFLLIQGAVPAFCKWQGVTASSAGLPTIVNRLYF